MVTGGGTGLGKCQPISAIYQNRGTDNIAIAGGFLENGAKVYITGRRKEVLDQTAEELKKLGGSGTIITYDHVPRIQT